jgi:hypothetical protein
MDLRAGAINRFARRRFERGKSAGVLCIQLHTGSATCFACTRQKGLIGYFGNRGLEG